MSGIVQSKTAEEMRRQNPEAFNPVINGRMMRPPIRMLYIHSVARRDFVVSNEPLFRKLKLRGCTNGERYVTCSSHPDPLPQSCTDHERGGTRIDDNDTWMCLIDLLSPKLKGHTLDPYAGSDNPDFYANRFGTNLISEGLWPSENKVPTEAEIKKAEACRDRRYRWQTQQAMTLAAKSTRELNEFLTEHPDVHLAMDALGLTAPWHQANIVKATCPNCGEDIKQGVAYHMNGPILCVIDAERSYKAGAITKERFHELTGTEEKRKPGNPNWVKKEV